VVPLVLATGAGAEMRRALGVAVFWGMLGVTLFGIFLTPVFFYVIGWFSRMRPALAAGPPPPAPAEPPLSTTRPLNPETGIQERPHGPHGT
jgi:hypothetical protein